MSIWMDESEGDSFDVPPAVVGSDEVVAPDDDLLAPVGEGEEWTPDQGYPDSTLSVRVWIDDDRRLAKVRLSNRWRDRAKGTSLSSMFDEAFLLANATVGSPLPPLAADEDEDVAVDPMSWEAIEADLAALATLQEEQAALDALPAADVVPSRWVGQEVEGLSPNKMVAVRLSVQGRTRKVAFNEGWLRQARVSEVCDAVMQAHRAAYAVFVPGEFVPGDLDRVASKFRKLEKRSMARLRRGPMVQGGS